MMSKVYLKKQDDRIREATFEDAFPFLNEKKHVISLVGGGGKTTLMYLLADCFCKKGYQTLVTTTTHIQKPKADDWIHNEEELKMHWESGKIAVAGEESGPEKIMGIARHELARYMQYADAVLVEADGAKRMACKVPNDREPVLLPQSDIVIGVMGLDVAGKTLREACFRLEQAMKLLQVPADHKITEEDMVKILTNSNGTRKSVGLRDYYVVLNKCDDAMRLKSAEKIVMLLEKQGLRHAVATKLL